MRRVIAAVLTLAAMVAAAWLSRPEPPGAVGQSFQRPGVIEISHPDGVGTSRHVVQVAGRVLARKEVHLSYRWLLDPVEVEVVQPDGVVELELADFEDAAGAPAMRIEPGQVAWRDADGVLTQRPRHGDRYALRYEDGDWSFLEDGDVLERVPGPPPGGPASLHLLPNASFRAFTARLADGDERTVDGGEVVSPWSRAAWAALSVLGAVLCLRGWRHALTGTARGGARVLAGLTAAAVVAACALALHAHNAERLGRAPRPCNAAAFVGPDRQVVIPGSPWDLSPRRDGDFVLTADVVLDDRSALDVLLRAAPPDRDTGLILTLSSDPALPSSLSRNLGTFLETVPGAEPLRRLEPRVVHAVRVRCEGGETVASVDGVELATIVDRDLRTGRCAFLSLRGRAAVQDLRIESLGQPRAADGVLLRWQVLTALGLIAGLGAAAALAGRGPGGVLWAWPLAVAAAPGAPDGAVVPGLVGAALLLALTPRAGRRALAWLIGAGVLVLFAWGATERAPANARGELNALHVTDVWGPALPAEYVWARHPLCRRFSGYVRRQQFRDEVARPAKPAPVTRIAALGSSSTYGYGVPADDAFIAQLERRLERDGYAVDGLNCGQPGATAERLRFFLEGAVLQYDLDVVIIDLSFNDVHVAAYDERAHFAAMTSTGIGPLRAAWARLAQVFALRSRGEYLAAFRRGEDLDPDLVERDAAVPARRFAASLRDMIAAVRAAGARVVLVAEPYNRQRGLTDIEPNHAAMAALAAELDVPFVDPQARLDAAQGTREVFVDVVHPNRAGHAIIAAMLAETLVREGLLAK